jgi:hypothetical protein
MYIRTISRKNKDGSEVSYVQLAHNRRDKETGYAKADVFLSSKSLGGASLFG